MGEFQRNLDRLDGTLGTFRGLTWPLGLDPQVHFSRVDAYDHVVCRYCVLLSNLAISRL